MSTLLNTIFSNNKHLSIMNPLKSNVPNPFDNLFETATNISKAGAYDIVAKQRDELIKENEKLKELQRSFYMDICRAYNAGKENMLRVLKVEVIEGKKDDSAYIGSHDYFVSEFPQFKTNVP